MSEEIFILGFCALIFLCLVVILAFGFIDERRNRSLREYNERREKKWANKMNRKLSSKAQVIKFKQRGDSNE